MQVLLPAEYARLRVGELVEALFPDDEQHRRLVEGRFDLLENPDLPEIYSVILDAFSQWRQGHCTLTIAAKSGVQIELSDWVAQHLQQPIKQPKEGPNNSPSFPTLGIAIDQEYRPLDYAVEQGCWESKQELLEWLQSLMLLYYLDKHECRLPAGSIAEVDRHLTGITAVAVSQNLIASEEAGVFTITEFGRQTIGRLLTETESYISQYDVFKDVAYYQDAGLVEFETGRGEDLRVQVFQAEGLDPVRTVFLLRLYDGTLDEILPTWQQLIHQAEFFDRILEPVVNHYQVDENIIGWIIEGGYAYLAEREDTYLEQRSHWEVLEMLNAL